MTVIAALADGSTVWMAADTAEHFNGTLFGRVRKVRPIELPHGAGKILLGVAGAPGLMTVAQRKIPDGPGELIPDYGLDDWADSVAMFLTETCAATAPPLTEGSSSSTTAVDGMWLLGYRGRLWVLSTHHAMPVPDGVAAIGSGVDLALGWMLAARRLSDLGAHDVVAGAVEATCAHIPHCKAPDGPTVEVLTSAFEEDAG